MDDVLREFATRQSDLVAAWQLRGEGWTVKRIRHQAGARGWRRVHQGVYALTQGPLTRRQQWIAAVLTAPNTVLSHASAGDCFGFRPFKGTYETVTRPGSGGPRRFGGVLVFRSKTLTAHTTVRDGIAITTPERTIINLCPDLDAKERARAIRDAIRLKCTTALSLAASLSAHPNKPGGKHLRELAARYASLPIDLTRADSEAIALDLLQQAGIELPKVNHRIAREEADLVWLKQRVIVEIDGPQFHQFRDEDLRKQAAWESAGFLVHRIPSDDVYERPTHFVAFVARALDTTRR